MALAQAAGASSSRGSVGSFQPLHDGGANTQREDARAQLANNPTNMQLPRQKRLGAGVGCSLRLAPSFRLGFLCDVSRDLNNSLDG